MQCLRISRQLFLTMAHGTRRGKVHKPRGCTPWMLTWCYSTVTLIRGLHQVWVRGNRTSAISGFIKSFITVQVSSLFYSFSQSSLPLWTSLTHSSTSPLRPGVTTTIKHGPVLHSLVYILREILLLWMSSMPCLIWPIDR